MPESRADDGRGQTALVSSLARMTLLPFFDSRSHALLLKLSSLTSITFCCVFSPLMRKTPYVVSLPILAAIIALSLTSLIRPAWCAPFRRHPSGAMSAVSPTDYASFPLCQDHHTLPEGGSARYTHQLRSLEVSHLVHLQPADCIAHHSIVDNHPHSRLITHHPISNRKCTRIYGYKDEHPPSLFRNPTNPRLAWEKTPSVPANQTQPPGISGWACEPFPTRSECEAAGTEGFCVIWATAGYL